MTRQGELSSSLWTCDELIEKSAASSALFSFVGERGVGDWRFLAPTKWGRGGSGEARDGEGVLLISAAPI
ncbi:hypothetical protein D3Y55_04275 [Mesorhizobium sp. DCY119]|nr:hypothetical protein D3Y55_04275 [Mesorhizobium sp. DCY119]